jgi:hypothetical protein
MYSGQWQTLQALMSILLYSQQTMHYDVLYLDRVFSGTSSTNIALFYGCVDVPTRHKDSHQLYCCYWFTSATTSAFRRSETVLNAVHKEVQMEMQMKITGYDIRTVQRAVYKPQP